MVRLYKLLFNLQCKYVGWGGNIQLNFDTGILLLLTSLKAYYKLHTDKYYIKNKIYIKQMNAKTMI
jgi:hypothetical protein